jgi:prepilin-type N-terminal cleavage/methylation domain-containing protein
MTASAPHPLPQRPAGFTLIEMLVVLAILGMLLGFAGVAMMRYLQTGNVTNCQARITAMALLLDSYADRMGDFPPGRLAALGITDANAVNEGSEALVAALRSEEWGGRRPEESWLGNVDADATQTKRFADGSRALLEFTDPWDNPIIYIVHGDYEGEALYRLSGDYGEEDVTARAARNPLTGGFHRFESYQLLSAGPDGLLGTEDDIANYEIASPESD